MTDNKKAEPVKPDLSQENIVQIDGEDYLIPGKTAIDAANLLTMAWDKLGKPDTIFSENGKKLMTVLIELWQDLYPEESKQWMEERKNYQDNELSAQEQVSKETGRSLASMPMFIHTILKVLFKEEKQDSEYFKKLVKEYPMFRMTNKV